MWLLPKVRTSVPVHTAWRTRPEEGRTAMGRQARLAGSNAAASASAWYWSMTSPPTTITSRPVHAAFGSPRVASGPESTVRHPESTPRHPATGGVGACGAGPEVVVGTAGGAAVAGPRELVVGAARRAAVAAGATVLAVPRPRAATVVVGRS